MYMYASLRVIRGSEDSLQEDQPQLWNAVTVLCGQLDCDDDTS